MQTLFLGGARDGEWIESEGEPGYVEGYERHVLTFEREFALTEEVYIYTPPDTSPVEFFKMLLKGYRKQ